jgi:NAD-specific glutamate dehydrogenase
MCLNYAVPSVVAIKCALAAEVLLASEEVRSSLSVFDTWRDANRFMILRTKLSAGVRHACAWLISSHGATLTLGQMVETYRAAYATLVLAAEELFPSSYGIPEVIHQYREMGLSDLIARRLAVTPYLSNVLDILSISKVTTCDVKVVAPIYFEVLFTLRIETLLGLEDRIETLDKWEHQLLVTSYDDIRRALTDITKVLVPRNQKKPSGLVEPVEPETVKSQLVNSIAFPSYLTVLDEVLSEKPKAMSLSVIARQLGRIHDAMCREKVQS